MDVIIMPLGALFRLCYSIISNYGAAILLFSVFTKVILLPISLWTQKNSVKVVKLQPALNRIKVRHFGDKDTISDEQLALYKTEKYNPFLSLVPLFVQIFLLICLIRIIYAPLTHILRIDTQAVGTLINSLCAATGADAASPSIQLLVVNAVRDGIMGAGTFTQAIASLDMSFLGFDLAAVPVTAGGIMYIVPFAAGLSAFVLSAVQNRLNPLQSQQKALGKYSTMAVSVGISLVLGGFVPAGVGWYWVCSNALSIIQQLFLNKIINPKKLIDYEELEASRKALEALESLGKRNSPHFGGEEYKRERADYKRFFAVGNKHIVFYSESNGFYKYFESLIEYLLSHSNAVIHYITSDPNDKIFKMAKENGRIRAYYFGERKLITVFMKMDADIVIMTMPDIGNYHFKRSIVRKDIEYIYMFHYPLSTHMVLGASALDNYDTVFCVGEFQFDEIRRREELYGLPQKNLLLYGYGQLEKLQKSFDAMEKTRHERLKVLIAPSWQADNILDICIFEMLDVLLSKGFEVHVRPHPEYVKRYAPRMEAITEKYKDYNGGDLVFELDFTSNASIYDSDVVITDWSGTAYEFSFVTLRPSVFIDTPPKINNKDYEKLGIEPLELTLRDKIGKSFSPDSLEELDIAIKELADSSELYKKSIGELREKYIANYMNCAREGGRYIVGRLIEREKNKQ